MQLFIESFWILDISFLDIKCRINPLYLSEVCFYFMHTYVCWFYWLSSKIYIGFRFKLFFKVLKIHEWCLEQIRMIRSICRLSLMFHKPKLKLWVFWESSIAWSRWSDWWVNHILRASLILRNRKINCLIYLHKWLELLVNKVLMLHSNHVTRRV